jgi:hypothetical protein
MELFRARRDAPERVRRLKTGGRTGLPYSIGLGAGIVYSGRLPAYW